jgi:cytochrome c
VIGYNYSGALVKVAEVWDIDNLNEFLENPKTYAPGTKMGFAGLKKPNDRANLIAYLDSFGE